MLRRIGKLVDEADRWAAIPRAVVWSPADLARAVRARRDARRGALRR